MLLMLVTGTFLAWSPKTCLIAMVSLPSFSRGAGAVGVDVVDVGGRELRVGQRLAACDDRALAFGVLVGDAERVGGRAVADDLGEDRRAAALRVLERFEDDHARAFAEHEPAAVGVERAAGARRVLVERSRGRSGG